MPSFNRPLVPAFLKTLDNYLLKNKPDLWSTRVHLTVWYSLLTTLVVTALYYLANRDAREETFDNTWFPYVMILCALGLIIYLFYVVRFNVFKRFGNLNIYKHGARQFLFTFIAMASMCMPLVLPSIAEGFWANNQYSEKEIIKDAEDINFQYHIIEKSAELTWASEQVKVVTDTNDVHLVRWMDSAEYYEKLRRDSINVLLENNYTNEKNAAVVVAAASEQNISNDTTKRNIKTWTPISYRREVDVEKVPFGDIDVFIHKAYFDSLVKHKDSVVSKGKNIYIFYTCPDLQTCSSPFTEIVYDKNNGAEIKPPSDKAIYYKLKAYGKPNDAKTESDKFEKLISKYITDDQRLERANEYNASATETNNSRVREVEESMRNIENKMEQNQIGRLVLYFNGVLITAICLTLILLIFRHTTQRTFWLSALSFILLLILTSLLLISTRTNDNLEYIYIIYTLVFGTIAATTYYATHRTLKHGISINIAILGVCALPAVIYGIIESAARQAVYSAEQMHINTATQRALITALQSKLDNIDAFGAFMPSICLLMCLLLFAFVFAPIAKRWYSMPVK
jgi:hypothetical protein